MSPIFESLRRQPKWARRLEAVLLCLGSVYLCYSLFRMNLVTELPYAYNELAAGEALYDDAAAFCGRAAELQQEQPAAFPERTELFAADLPIPQRTVVARGLAELLRRDYRLVRIGTYGEDIVKVLYVEENPRIDPADCRVLCFLLTPDGDSFRFFGMAQ